MTLTRKISTFSFVILSFATIYVLGHSEIFEANSHRLSNLIIADVLLTIPFVYFLLIRKSEISKLTVLPVMISGVVLASFIIPKENQYLLDLFKTWALPIIELSVFSFIVFKVVRTIKTYKAKREDDSDFFTVLKATCSEHFPKFVATALATEIAVIYYGFINWRKPKPEHNSFTYHKKSGSVSLFAAFILILAAESVGVHYLLRESENQVGLWILTGLSLYTVFQVLGFVKSILQRTIKITKTHLLLRYGIMKDAKINLLNVMAVEISSRSIDKNKSIKTLSILGGFKSHNFILHFENEITIKGLYGINRKAKSIALSIDEPEEFKAALKEAKGLLKLEVGS